jgi:glycosyltransferase involved in cell wall biosynthesis
LHAAAEVSGPPFEELYRPEGGTLGGIPGDVTDARPEHDPTVRSDRARILLGYPDQFYFATPSSQATTVISSFLWTQLSRPPKPLELGFYRLIQPVALTERTRSFLAASVGRFYSGDIPIIPHGVDVGLFRPPLDPKRGREIFELKRRLGLEDAFVVGTVAANSFRKRYDRMFEAFAVFKRKIRGVVRRRPRFVVKTDRVRALDGRDLSETANRYGIAADVLFLVENLDDAELASLVGSFDLYLNLSEWEGFCIPVIEAMACGVPVVSHDVQGPGELLPCADMIVPGSTRHTEEGVLLLDASPEQAAEVLERAYRDEELRGRASEMGRRVCVDRYDIHRVARRWLELLTERSKPSVEKMS